MYVYAHNLLINITPIACQRLFVLVTSCAGCSSSCRPPFPWQFITAELTPCFLSDPTCRSSVITRSVRRRVPSQFFKNKENKECTSEVLKWCLAVCSFSSLLRDGQQHLSHLSHYLISCWTPFYFYTGYKNTIIKICLYFFSGFAPTYDLFKMLVIKKKKKNTGLCRFQKILSVRKPCLKKLGWKRRISIKAKHIIFPSHMQKKKVGFSWKLSRIKAKDLLPFKSFFPFKKK